MCIFIFLYFTYMWIRVLKMDLMTQYLPDLETETVFKMNLNDVKINVDAKSDFKPARNTWPEIDSMTWMNTYMWM